MKRRHLMGETFDAVKAGCFTAKALTIALGIHPDNVSKVMRLLVDGGWIARHGSTHGVRYSLVAGAHRPVDRRIHDRPQACMDNLERSHTMPHVIKARIKNLVTACKITGVVHPKPQPKTELERCWGFGCTRRIAPTLKLVENTTKPSQEGMAAKSGRKSRNTIFDTLDSCKAASG